MIFHSVVYKRPILRVETESPIVNMVEAGIIRSTPLPVERPSRSHPDIDLPPLVDLDTFPRLEDNGKNTNLFDHQTKNNYQIKYY